MIIYPAIDIKNGKCVRLRKGKFDDVTQFNDDVVNQAQIFQEAGFKWLHIVDLDGAKEGRPVNLHLVKNIVDNTNLNIQLGGGIRTIEDVEKIINIGVNRVILGTIVINDISLVEKICKKFPGKVAVGLDAIGNKVAIEGWQKETNIYIFDLIKQLKKIGISAIIYTDISRDGLLAGFDELGTMEIAKEIDIPIIASGGVAKMEDLEKLSKMANYGVEGVIIGRAFYEKKISYDQALNFFNK